ncbi:MAG: acyl-protein synthetase [Armatimonadota bacterium]
MHKNNVDVLCGDNAAFLLDSNHDNMFLKAMKDAFSFHYLHLPVYKKYCDNYGFTPKDLKKYGDLNKMPFIFVNVFKQKKLLTVKDKDVQMIITSSGTGGRKSYMYLDNISLRRIIKIIYNIYNDFGMYNRSQKTNYLCFTYDPLYAADVGTAFSDKLLATLTLINKIYYSIEFDKRIKDFRLNKEKSLKVLKDYEQDGLPVRILGLPAFLYEVIKDLGKGFKLSRKSHIIIGGGWKTLKDKEIPKDEFRALIEEKLGMPKENIRDLYGLVEHGVPYSECEYANMHVSIYSRVIIRDPGTLKVLPPGKTGLIQLQTPYINTIPAISILTGDMGVLHYDCPCGRKSPVLKLMGRGGVHKHKGCAITALDILK